MLLYIEILFIIEIISTLEGKNNQTVERERCLASVVIGFRVSVSDNHWLLSM